MHEIFSLSDCSLASSTKPSMVLGSAAVETVPSAASPRPSGVHQYPTASNTWSTSSDGPKSDCGQLALEHWDLRDLWLLEGYGKQSHFLQSQVPGSPFSVITSQSLPSDLASPSL